jgi:hypothetical protein
MYSFGLNHDIGPDHPWDDSKTTMRQKIRQNFKNAGRMYYVPKARFCNCFPSFDWWQLIDPMAPMIVPPIEIDQELLKWYTVPPNKKPVHSLQDIEQKRKQGNDLTKNDLTKND